MLEAITFSFITISIFTMFHTGIDATIIAFPTFGTYTYTSDTMSVEASMGAT
jgi:hypothetical protein